MRLSFIFFIETFLIFINFLSISNLTLAKELSRNYIKPSDKSELISSYTIHVYNNTKNVQTNEITQNKPETDHEHEYEEENEYSHLAEEVEEEEEEESEIEESQEYEEKPEEKVKEEKEKDENTKNSSHNNHKHSSNGHQNQNHGSNHHHNSGHNGNGQHVVHQQSSVESSQNNKHKGHGGGKGHHSNKHASNQNPNEVSQIREEYIYNRETGKFERYYERGEEYEVQNTHKGSKEEPKDKEKTHSKGDKLILHKKNKDKDKEDISGESYDKKKKHPYSDKDKGSKGKHSDKESEKKKHHHLNKQKGKPEEKPKPKPTLKPIKPEKPKPSKPNKPKPEKPKPSKKPNKEKDKKHIKDKKIKGKNKNKKEKDKEESSINNINEDDCNPCLECKCDKETFPVCGSNAITYQNPSILSCKAKICDKSIKFARCGRCDAPKYCLTSALITYWKKISDYVSLKPVYPERNQPYPPNGENQELGYFQLGPPPYPENGNFYIVE